MSILMPWIVVATALAASSEEALGADMAVQGLAELAGGERDSVEYGAGGSVSLYLRDWFAVDGHVQFLPTSSVLTFFPELRFRLAGDQDTWGGVFLVAGGVLLLVFQLMFF
jgi:hypothetical protein